MQSDQTREPDARKIDAECAAKVMGWTEVANADDAWAMRFEGVCFRQFEGRKRRDFSGPYVMKYARGQGDLWRPSTNIADAMAVLEKFLTGKGVGEWVDIRMRKGRVLVSIFKSGDDDEIGTAVADTLPMAICLAALRAVGAERIAAMIQHPPK